MTLNEGKHTRVYHKFLGEEYRIDELPCGVSIPFTVEMTKLRQNSLVIVNNIDPDTPEYMIVPTLNTYFASHPEEAQDQMNLMIRALSVLTEFFSDGRIDENCISKKASIDDVSNFLEHINKAQVGENRKK